LIKNIIKMKNKKIWLILFILNFGIFTNKSFSQTGERIRALWIFNIAHDVTWKNLEKDTVFTIGVFSSNEEFIEISKMAKNRRIKKKRVKVIKYDNYKDVKSNHIIFVTKNENANLSLIYQKLKGENVLIISDRSHKPQYSVINLNKENAKQPFTINGELCKMQKLKLSMQLLRIGGDRAELKKIQAETNKKLLEEKKRLSEIQRECEFKDMEIKVLKEKLRKCEEKNKTK